MDFIEENVKLFIKEQQIENVNVKWSLRNFEGYAYFETKNFSYYLKIAYATEQTIFDVVEEMLSVAS